MGQVALELARATFHAATGLAIIAVYATGWPPGRASQALLPFTLSFVAFDIARLRAPRLNAVFLRLPLFRAVIREGERRERLTSSSFFLLGAHAAMAVLDRPVATLALLLLAWCDPAARIAGKSARRRPWTMRIVGRKSLAGSGAAALLGVLVTFCFVAATADRIVHGEEGNMTSAWRLLRTAVWGGAAAAIGEALAIPRVDDNLTMPLVSGLILALSPLPSYYSAIVS